MHEQIILNCRQIFQSCHSISVSKVKDTFQLNDNSYMYCPYVKINNPTVILWLELFYYHYTTLYSSLTRAQGPLKLDHIVMFLLVWENVI